MKMGSQRAPLFRCVRGFDVCQKVVYIFITNWVGLESSLHLPRKLNPLRDRRDGIFRAHTVVRIVSDESRLLPAVMMSGVIASDDALHLPPLQFVIELMPRDTDFAHEQLKELVDGS